MSVLKKLNFPSRLTAGIAMELILTFLLLIPAAMIMNRQLLGNYASAILPPVVAGLAVFLTAMVLVKVQKKQPYAMGAALGGAYVLLAAVLCALGGPSCEFGRWILWLGLAAVVGGLLGANAFAGKKNQKRRHRRR